MREEQTDLWAAVGLPLHHIGISTNGFVKKNGRAVMGRGCALQAALRWPQLPEMLGDYIRIEGNVPGYLQHISGDLWGDRLIVLPVKHNWWERADITLIRNSIEFLSLEAQAHPDWTFHVPRLGCGNGKLKWAEVREHFWNTPDNVVVHS